ncbi:MAG: SAM-dependent methyltransferase [Alphaproteobacteria bacterium]|nr:SAM-dependent methyltransferase [Alphaproteobacteria bacterium]
MNALGQRIARLIAAQGPISIAQFMSIALHDPVLGYYATQDPIGRRGDFVTAPEISQMFGELLGAWIVQAWRDQGSRTPVTLIELGPGRGTLMADVLRAAKLDPAFLAAIQVVLVETSAALRRAQAEKLGSAAVPVRWANRLDESLSEGGPLFLVANEFFDALPIRQFVFTERRWCERMVGSDGRGALTFALSPQPLPIQPPPERGKPELGTIYETSGPGEGIVERVAEAIAANGGAALIVDYGYGAKAGFGETLQAVSRQRYAGVLDNPGEADLSAHVDFAALAHSAEKGGTRAHGPVGQGAFLLSLGIADRADRLARSNPNQRATIAAAVERLISPLQMGELFKAIAILPQAAPVPAGF